MMSVAKQIPPLIALCFSLFISAHAHAKDTFANPIGIGADPWIIQHENSYYWCQSANDLGVAICKTDSLTTFGTRQVVWRAPERGPYSKETWAPELHFLDGHWYIYVAASNGRNENHRMIALESETADPLSKYTFKAELYTGDDIENKSQNRWAIDGTIFELNGQRYFIWSGWETNKDEQWLYIAPMSNPWTISANRVRVCNNDDYTWERVDDSPSERGLNEGPQILQNNGRTFIIYSASASWKSTYKLGLLELKGDNPLDPAAWIKHPTPVFAPTSTTPGVGHGSFTKSPDGKEDWIVYHAKLSPKDGWHRGIFVQPFTWNQDGSPNFGNPVARGQPLSMPSDMTKSDIAHAPFTTQTNP